MSYVDERLPAAAAAPLLDALYLYRCTGCGLPLVQADPLFRVSARHRRCPGAWQLIHEALPRALWVRFLSRQMLSGVARR
jgi:hypothetical protein